MANCTAWNNTVNFDFNDAVTVTKVHELRNNIAFAYYPHPDQSGASNARLIDGTTSEYNTWDTATNVTADSSDFVSLSVDDALTSRGSDGSLPTQFGRLNAGAAEINKGVDVGLPFSGTAPDLGAYEYEGTVDVKVVTQNVNRLFKVKSLSVSDKLIIKGDISQMPVINMAIIDLSGKLLRTTEFADDLSGKNAFTVNVNALTSGVYLCVLNCKSNGNTVNETIKFIKK